MTYFARHWVRATTAALALVVTTPALAVPTTSFGLSGVRAPGTYDLARLRSLPAVTQTDTFLMGTTPQTHTYTGTSLWNLVNGAGIPVNPAVSNDILDKFVLVTGSDGYKVVLSMGEIHPNFGNRPDLVAYAETVGGVSSPLGADGFARTTAVGDVRGGRYVSNVAALQVQSGASTLTGSGGGPSSSFTVSGDVSAPTTFDLVALQALPSHEYTVGSDVYVGIGIYELLTAIVGVPTNPGVKNDLLGKYVVATGSDGYRVVYSMGELDPAFGNQPDFIAYSLNGRPLAANGFARTIVPNDARRGRWVSNLIGLEVFSAQQIPEPTTALLLGIASLGALAARREKPAVRRSP